MPLWNSLALVSASHRSHSLPHSLTAARCERLCENRGPPGSWFTARATSQRIADHAAAQPPPPPLPPPPSPRSSEGGKSTVHLSSLAPRRPTRLALPCPAWPPPDSIRRPGRARPHQARQIHSTAVSSPRIPPRLTSACAWHPPASPLFF